MSNTFVMRDLLLHELGVGVRTAKALVGKIEDDQWGFRPHENMRTLLELTNHLVQIPLADLAILQEKSEAEVQALGTQLQSSSSAELVTTLERGYQALTDYMLGLSETDFLEKTTKAFYAESASTQAHWLVEIVTHFFHHRAQVFTYMKQQGVPVTMFDLY